jgi:hypothetical protein
MPDRYEELAHAALLEITPASTVGGYLGQSTEEDGSITLRFASAQPGYPDWLWTVAVADVEGGEPTVLEAELLPGDESLLAPDWLPWSDRLAEYKAAQEALGVTAADDADDESDDDDDDDPDDDDDVDDDESDDEDDDLDDHVMDDDDVLGSDVLHGGDLDGVDIDDHDEDADDEGDDDDADEGERSF